MGSRLSGSQLDSYEAPATPPAEDTRTTAELYRLTVLLPLTSITRGFGARTEKVLGR